MMSCLMFTFTHTKFKGTFLVSPSCYNNEYKPCHTIKNHRGTGHGNKQNKLINTLHETVAALILKPIIFQEICFCFSHLGKIMFQLCGLYGALGACFFVFKLAMAFETGSFPVL